MSVVQEPEVSIPVATPAVVQEDLKEGRWSYWRKRLTDPGSLAAMLLAAYNFIVCSSILGQWDSAHVSGIESAIGTEVVALKLPLTVWDVMVAVVLLMASAGLFFGRWKAAVVSALIGLYLYSQYGFEWFF